MPKRIINISQLLEMMESGKTQKEAAAQLGVSPAAVCKRLKKLLPPPPALDSLTDKKKNFVIKVSKGLSQTQAAAESFNCSTRASAKALGSQLMNEPDVNKGIKEVMDYYGLTRSFRVRRLKTHIENPDALVSLRALDQSWRLDGYIEKHLNVAVDINELNKRRESLQDERQRLISEIDKLKKLDPNTELPD